MTILLVQPKERIRMRSERQMEKMFFETYGMLLLSHIYYDLFLITSRIEQKRLLALKVVFGETWVCCIFRGLKID